VGSAGIFHRPPREDDDVLNEDWIVSRMVRSRHLLSPPTGAIPTVQGCAALLVGPAGALAPGEFQWTVAWYDGGPAPAASQPPWLSWDHEQHLKYVVPFDGAVVRIHLDPLLPHIVKLALDAEDRQVFKGRGVRDSPLNGGLHGRPVNRMVSSPSPLSIPPTPLSSLPGVDFAVCCMDHVTRGFANIGGCCSPQAKRCSNILFGCAEGAGRAGGPSPKAICLFVLSLQG
jgi:hypothetical protein